MYTLKTWHAMGVTVIVLITLLIVSTMFVFAPASQGQVSSTRFVDGEVLVKFKSLTSIDQVDRTLAARDLTVIEHLEEAGIQRLAVPAGKEQEMARWLASSDLVEYAAPNYIAYAAIEPNDDYWSSMQWNMRLIGAPAGWDIVTGTQAITIAVLDTGIDLDHPDLVSKLVPGSNIIEFGTPPDDDHGHGTHVAGIAAASTNNWIGVAGVDWQARLMPIKVCDSEAVCPYSAIIDGIYNAANSGAQIINLSLAGWDDFEGLHEAVRHVAETRGVFVVTAAGNCAAGGVGCPGINPIAYPAQYDETIAVGAVTRYDQWASYSEYHPYVDIVAPGGDGVSPIWSTNLNAGYSSRSGTSMSVPHVSGLAALIWAINPALTAEQVWEVMRDTASKVDSFPYVNGRNDHCGYGRIDVATALQRVAPGLVVPQTQLSFLAGDNRPLPSDHITITNTSKYSALAWNAALGIGAAWFEIVPPTSGTLGAGESTQMEIRPRTAGLSEGTYQGELRVTSDTRAVQGSPQIVPLSLTYLPQLHLALIPALPSMAGGAGGYEWLDAKPGGIALTLPDDGSAKVNLPFDFPFYGQTYNQMWVSSNGFVSFQQAGTASYQNHCIPDLSTPNNAIYAFWDDLDPSSVGGVYVKAFDSDTYVIQWDGVPHSIIGGGPAVTETFQIVLRSDGLVKFQYQTVGDGTSCTVGVEDSAGSNAQQVLCNGVGEALQNRKVLTVP